MPLGHLHAGFVGMEYFALILNRSFVVLIADQGLLGWKFSGPVTPAVRDFFRPFEQLLDDPEVGPGTVDFNELMSEPGTFLIPYSEIRSVVFAKKLKWGMGGFLTRAF